MNSQKNERIYQWIKGEVDPEVKFDKKPGTKNIQHDMLLFGSKNYQGSPTTGITAPGNSAKSESHNPQKRKPGKLPIHPTFTADVAVRSNGGRPNEPINNELHETSSVTHPTKVENLSPYEKYKAKLKKYKTMFESNIEENQGDPNFAQHYLPNQTGVKETRRNNDDTTAWFPQPQSTVDRKPAVAPSEDTNRQTTTQHENEDASEHSQNSLETGSDTNQGERKHGHSAQENQKEKAESTSKNGNGTSLGNKRGYMDDSSNSGVSKQNSESEAAAKSQETQSSSNAIVSETRPQTPIIRTLKSNKDHGGNQQNHVSGHKGDQNNIEVLSTVKEKKIPEIISRGHGQNFELHSMLVADTIGIRGFNNSCYMDSSLVSLFLYDTHKSFSELIQKSKTTGNGKHSLNEKIRTDFNNLTQLLINDDADSRILDSAKNKFRKSLSKIDVSYLREDKDAEEFLLTLFGLVLGCSPFYSIAGEDGGDYIFQTYGSPNIADLGRFPSVQQLLNQSFNHYNIELKDVPHPGFIIKLPVTNGRHMFPRVFPNLTLSLKNIMEDKQTEAGSAQMLLSAVICLQANHHTAFVRIDPDDLNSSWVYKDSFKHNEYTLITNLSEILQEPYQNFNEEDALLKLLFENAYICVYSPAK